MVDHSSEVHAVSRRVNVHAYGQLKLLFWKTYLCPLFNAGLEKKFYSSWTSKPFFQTWWVQWPTVITITGLKLKRLWQGLFNCSTWKARKMTIWRKYLLNPQGRVSVKDNSSYNYYIMYLQNCHLNVVKAKWRQITDTY